ncbi:hypothetical protein [Actinopolymorpha pittospori]|uniref:Uncharacterized protein n=1 Tax=Actinopolymorpha pittospori TaxID=648752 RepID=A0A927RJ88_9ACTN|nr:hypothetical protein [Actinopolymorpha pittospori]
MATAEPFRVATTLALSTGAPVSGSFTRPVRVGHRWADRPSSVNA